MEGIEPRYSLSFLFLSFMYSLPRVSGGGRIRVYNLCSPVSLGVPWSRGTQADTPSKAPQGTQRPFDGMASEGVTDREAYLDSV